MRNWPVTVLLVFVAALALAGDTAYVPPQSSSAVGPTGTISSNLSGPTFDATIDDLTCDVATCASFVLTCDPLGLACGSSWPNLAGTPVAADAGTTKGVTDDLFFSIVQPASGGTAARTGSASNAVVTGTGNQVTMVPIFTILAAADTGCAAAGTVDATPSCAREACSNMGLLCHDAVTLASFAVPVFAAADCTTEAGAGVVDLVACY